MGGGKSWGGAMLFVNLAIKQPGTRYAVCRKNMTVLKRTTYQTFRKYARVANLVEGRDYKEDRQQMVWEFPNGSQIWFLELDHTRDPDFDKLKGMELTAAMIDEANEVIEDAFIVLMGRIGRENDNGEPGFIYMTCNPTHNWVKAKFYNPWVAGKLKRPYAFIQSLPSDNPYNRAEYLKGLEDMPAQFYKRYVEGSWDYVDDADSLIAMRSLDKAEVDKPPIAEKKSIGVDVAREGKDSNVFALIEDDCLTDLYVPEISTGEDADTLIQVAKKVIEYAERNGVGYENVAIDAVGLGGGVVDYCRNQGFKVKEFKSGSAEVRLNEDGSKKYDMLRSQSYWELSQAIDKGEFTLYSGCNNLEGFRQDILAHKVELKPRFVSVESKEKLKKRLARSPDFSDAVMMGYWAMHPTNVYVPIRIGTAG